MVTKTHCRPDGSLAENQLPVPGVNDVVTTVMDPGAPRRAVVVYLHGLGNTGLPVPIVDATGGFFPSFLLSFANGLNAQDYVFIAPPYVSDTVADGDFFGRIAADIRSDPLHGARLKSTILHWWDHVLAYIWAKWDPDIPVIPFGGSWGGLNALTVVTNRPETIVAYGAHVPATRVTDINGFVDFSGLDTSVGLDVPLNGLNNIDKPGIIGAQAGDPIILDSNPKALANNAIGSGRDVTYYASIGAHTFTSTDATTYINWFISKVNPLCPAIF